LLSHGLSGRFSCRVGVIGSKTLDSRVMMSNVLLFLLFFCGPRVHYSNARSSNVATANAVGEPTPHNKSLDASGGGVFLKLLGAAKGVLIRAAASTQPFGVMETNFPTGYPSFGDSVRIRSSIETESNGVAGLVGHVYGQTTPSVRGV